MHSLNGNGGSTSAPVRASTLMRLGHHAFARLMTGGTLPLSAIMSRCRRPCSAGKQVAHTHSMMAGSTCSMPWPVFADRHSTCVSSRMSHASHTCCTAASGSVCEGGKGRQEGARAKRVRAWLQRRVEGQGATQAHTRGTVSVWEGAAGAGRQWECETEGRKTVQLH